METITTQGTITWFEVAKVGLPPAVRKNDIAQYSAKVLVTDGKQVESTEFVYSLKGEPYDWFGYNTMNFRPTHWAFINYPNNPSHDKR